MTSSVSPPFSSKVTVVTAPSSLSSFVHTRRECGVTSMYLPKNAIGFEASWPNTKRYLPPTRTSASQESRDMPVDFGAHHRLSSSGLVHASNTMRAGPLKVRVTTSSRSDFRSTVVRFFMGVGSLSLLASINLILPFQFRSPDGAERNPGSPRGVDAAPDFAPLHPGYACFDHPTLAQCGQLSLSYALLAAEPWLALRGVPCVPPL